MDSSAKKYDFVIAGSGMGGLLCAYVLSSEGYNVLVLEKNNQIGGNLQVFSRDKCIFDTGVHYIGSLDEGENLNQFFRYFGLLGNIKMKRMDEDGFDVIRFKDGKEYKYGQGHERFKAGLIREFPDESEAINTFCKKIKDVCSHFPLYNLKAELTSDYFLSDKLWELNAFEYIASITDNKKLQNVLAGSNPLYAGVRGKTPFYVLALILDSYLTGSYKLIDGGSQIAICLSKSIRKMGGEIRKRTKVTGADYDAEGKITNVVLESGEKIYADRFISNMHPSVTIDVFGEDRFLNAYKKRVRTLENTISSFTVHLTFKKDSFPYLNYNIYQYDLDDVWAGIDYKDEIWPEGYFLCTPATSKSDTYADSMTVMTYMKMEEVTQWSQTHNTTASPSDRTGSYEEFKKKKEEKVLCKLEYHFPGIRSKIKNVYSSTPLTYRDYIGTYDGSMYGILKDNTNPAKTFINSRTKIPNLFLTGQNLIFHGILGVTIGALVTCFEFTDRTKLVEKIKNAR